MYSHQSPKISVIVPVYNVEKYLPRCIDSILSQTFTDFELILIDDGSPDNSGKICDEYAEKDSRVRVFHKPNGGVSSARNLGLDKASGEWITFIDSDDYIEQDFLDIPSGVAEDLLLQNYKFIKNGECKKYVNPKFVTPTNEVQKIINRNIDKLIFRVPWAKFFRRKIIIDNRISFIEGIKVGEDTIFVLDYLCFTKGICFLSNAYYVYDVGIYDSYRYRMPVSDCIEIFHVILEKYEKLKADSIPFLTLISKYYYFLIYPRDYKSITEWQKNKEVKCVYNLIKSGLNREYRLRYALCSIVKRFSQMFNK